MWSVHSCFQWYKNYKNRQRNARAVVENNVASFFSGHGVVYNISTFWKKVSWLRDSKRITGTEAYQIGSRLDPEAKISLNVGASGIASEEGASERNSERVVGSKILFLINSIIYKTANVNVKTEFMYKCYRLRHRKQQKLEPCCGALRHCENVLYIVPIFAVFDVGVYNTCI